MPGQRGAGFSWQLPRPSKRLLPSLSSCSGRFGGQVGVGGHITIGDRVEMGGQAGVISNVPSGSALMGSPGIPLRDALKSFVLQPKLPDMYRRLQALEKELAELKQQATQEH